MPCAPDADHQLVTHLRRATMALAVILALALAAAPAAFADATIVVNSTADPGSGSSCAPGGSASCTLREALDLVSEGAPAGVTGAVTIVIQPSGQIVTGPNGTLVADAGSGVGAVSITGPGAGDLVLSGNEQARVLRVVDGSWSISGLTIADGQSATGGAGILAEGSSVLTLDAVRFTSNAATGPGGGLYLDTSGAATITDSEFNGNSTADVGGGLHTVGPATIERTTFVNNSATQAEDWTESGGGLSTTGTTLLLRNSTVSDNQGGGVSNVGGELTIRNSTLVGNGGYAVAGTLVVLQSSIVAGTGESPCLGGEVQSQGNNLVAETYEELDCTWSKGPADVFGADPQLGTQGFHGGPTQTVPPVSMDSAAINKGENPQPTDQRGLRRPVPDGVANTDVGSVEVQAPLLEVADPPSISPATDLVAGDTLTCDPGTWDTDTIADPEFSFAWLAGAEPLGSGETHVLDAADAGKSITCRVTVDNGVAAAEAGSAAVELEPAAAILAPTSLDFGSRRVGSGPGESQALTVTNTGGTDLTITEVTTSNPEFPVDSTDCTAVPLGPGEGCAIEVRFAPAAVGVQGSFVTVKSNGGEPVASVGGTATEPAFSVSPTSFDFGNQLANTTSAAKAFVVRNIGSAPLTLGEVAITGANPSEFALGEDECTDAVLDPGEECTVEASFSPDLTGPRSATLSIPGDPGGSAELTGTGTAPELSVTPTSFDFGNQRIDTTSAAQAFVVKNTGTASLAMGKVAIGGSNPGEFVLGTDGCTDAVLDPAEECTTQVSFSPDLVGPRSAILNIPGEDPASAELIGTGTAPVFSAAPTAVEFGQRLVSAGASGGKTVTVTNNGTASMAITTVTITGPTASQFALVPAGNGCAATTVDPGESCTVEVTFDPAETGPIGATLSFGGQAPGTVQLLGTGIAPALAIEPTSLNFGSHLVGTKSGVQPFVVKNTGSAPAEVFSVSVSGTGSGSFATGPTDTCTGVTLAIGAQCTVDVSFSPAAIGPKSASLDVSGAASVSAPLQGTGIVAKFAVVPTALDFGSREVAAGPSPAQTLTVQNIGTGVMTVESVTPTGAGAAAYAVPAASDKCAGATLEANQTCTVAVTFDPASAGPLPATLSFAGNAPGTVPLSGSGVEARFVATPGGHGFGDAYVGSSSDPVAFTIGNAGTAPMPLGSIVVSGPNPDSFHLVQNGCAGLTLSPGQECGLKVSLTPKEIGPLRAQLDVGTLGSLELVGNGLEPPPTLTLVKSKTAIPVKADGRFKVRVSCASLLTACKGAVTITLRRAPVARWSGKVASGAKKTVNVRLNKAAREELVSRGKLNALALVVSQVGELRTPLSLKARR